MISLKSAEKAPLLAGDWFFIGFALVLMLVYGVSPVDFVPDVLPLVGVVDDALVSVIAAAYMILNTAGLAAVPCSGEEPPPGAIYLS